MKFHTLNSLIKDFSGPDFLLHPKQISWGKNKLHISTTYLHNITRNIKDLLNLSFEPACDFYSCLIALYFTERLKFLYMIPLPRNSIVLQSEHRVDGINHAHKSQFEIQKTLILSSNRGNQPHLFHKPLEELALCNALSSLRKRHIHQCRRVNQCLARREVVLIPCTARNPQLKFKTKN